MKRIANYLIALAVAAFLRTHDDRVNVPYNCRKAIQQIV